MHSSNWTKNTAFHRRSNSLTSTLETLPVGRPSNRERNRTGERMKNKSAVYSAAVLSMLITCSPAFAHHGTGASYDLSKHITLKGTVTAFNWSNPHLQVYFDVKDNTGKVEHWVAEIRSSL